MKTWDRLRELLRTKPLVPDYERGWNDAQGLIDKGISADKLLQEAHCDLDPGRYNRGWKDCCRSNMGVAASDLRGFYESNASIERPMKPQKEV
jgi:hypothetical protein